LLHFNRKSQIELRRHESRLGVGGGVEQVAGGAELGGEVEQVGREHKRGGVDADDRAGR
jgi:hypothetical protein